MKALGASYVDDSLPLEVTDIRFKPVGVVEFVRVFSPPRSVTIVGMEVTIPNRGLTKTLTLRTPVSLVSGDTLTMTFTSNGFMLV